ncbi:2-amino-4-hydroxy-6-hydroxymethyldihydropteridine diphosphokinase [Allosaccharopolyspora coralli]|uniref:2-amino-4-hydroxy-6-hydroxymethyldihydropteridine diphosphokinase n=1 Tax=Allosaccharopolyspora coralli TaxID=2665642 RepID=A0A5Q3Q254_9PSEU|nr:2-amino-4-hydroxy-6-hydroxymethyldihydropteridine diphosphokinase [Allosaccharopolyspora coralli]QGK68423.1 2-amino-4-hydroxy-6-hydroxymethyldihydropteridine diphosphokinase [Allosaccharopolyspora coralli]
MSRAVLSLGSNLGERLEHLRLAVHGFGEDVVVTSAVYETEPWGVRDQPRFLNAVIVVAADGLDEWGWLRRGQALEAQAQRRREQRWGPRTLDVDVVTVDGVHSDHPDLVLPHPGTPSRASVLVPWLEADPEAVLPGHGPVRDLAAALSKEERDTLHRRPDLPLH